MKKMGRCVSCGAYTMLEEHCGRKAKPVHPPPYNINDRYARYRRKEKGLE
ncbi:MAG: nucleolar RNA-binding Nop10p family protein [Candidatus Micrarchaeota archaeon]